nr:MAG TPA_asm: hypothetical protein [Caudoviricetes sp.]
MRALNPVRQPPEPFRRLILPAKSLSPPGLRNSFRL